MCERRKQKDFNNDNANAFFENIGMRQCVIMHSSMDYKHMYLLYYSNFYVCVILSQPLRQENKRGTGLLSCERRDTDTCMYGAHRIPTWVCPYFTYQTHSRRSQTCTRPRDQIYMQLRRSSQVDLHVGFLHVHYIAHLLVLACKKENVLSPVGARAFV